MTAWTAGQAPTAVTPGSVTLIEGTAFCVCGPSGDILPGGTDGIFFQDTRLVSRWQLLADGEPVEPLTVICPTPFCATFAGRTRSRPGHTESTVLVTRTRYVGDGVREDIAVRNFSQEPVGLRIGLHVESDLADIFDVKANRIRPWGQRSTEASADGLTISSRLNERMRGVRVTSSGAIVRAGEVLFEIVVPAPRCLAAHRHGPARDRRARGDTALSAGPAGHRRGPGAAPVRLGTYQPAGVHQPPGPGAGAPAQPERPRLAAHIRRGAS